jgi:sterol desaturase/sphingolipid hydroxylase (fatty acid hydroxylase superfamily)
MPKRHASVHRAFDLSDWAYFLDFALVPIAIVAACFYAFAHQLSEIAVWPSFLGGLVIWSFAEYWIHRAIFHGATRFEPMHQQHHALPKDMIGAASWATFGGFSLFWIAAMLCAGQATGSMISAGFMAGYIFYCAIHVSMHHTGAFGFGRYGQMMMRLHRAHHRGGKGNFGVSSPIWDFVFRTYHPI